ncbi:hypothetical protein A1O7_07156 [Cladophialophora yegresii CBS 114405]|uniref:D-isomer specific 2-hydroxyacid dehydrogenase NAD-binding domain-containing protein n=1 Tax=Cladophialophora yegresii CBS 114405 TaxID=1182544 RepID=W9VM91_9EURO|nr:uncharacterized protein A1O7_07156 [Cladophialophora yegresii CBS 114405]EXJ56812.1 hypothetical protein A1O7_07156 [Cladophialophora yegresii CBS 114405]
MGGGPDKEHLLITLWEPEPKHITAEIKRRFPYIEITYLELEMSSNPWGGDLTKGVPTDLWKTVTILITLGTLPAKPEDAPNLKLIHLFSAGVDHYTTHPIFTDSDIPITTSSGIHGPPISEWIIMATLVASKHYNVLYEGQKAHQWQHDRRLLMSTTDWVGKTVGIAGYGSIGRQAARIFHAMGANVHAYTASPRSTADSRKDKGYIVPNTGDPDGTIPRAWYSGTSRRSLHTFLASGLDCLIIALPLTPATRHLFSTAEFDILAQTTYPGKKSRSAFVINIARGALIDQPALVKALNEETLVGAALDVADPEPLPADDPLWGAKNLILTPHVSGLGAEYAERAYDLFITNWGRREKGERMFNVVDRRRGY